MPTSRAEARLQSRGCVTRAQLTELPQLPGLLEPAPSSILQLQLQQGSHCSSRAREKLQVKEWKRFQPNRAERGRLWWVQHQTWESKSSPANQNIFEFRKKAEFIHVHPQNSSVLHIRAKPELLLTTSGLTTSGLLPQPPKTTAEAQRGDSGCLFFYLGAAPGRAMH